MRKKTGDQWLGAGERGEKAERKPQVCGDFRQDILVKRGKIRYTIYSYG
jgi:hypothetical protein